MSEDAPSPRRSIVTDLQEAARQGHRWGTIFEAESKTLLVQSIAQLREAIDNTTPANNAVNFGNNMVFWARNTFEEVNGKPMQIRLL